MQRFRILAISLLSLPAVGLFFIPRAQAQTAVSPGITNYQAELTFDDRAQVFITESFAYHGSTTPNFLRTIPYQRVTSWFTTQNIRPTVNEVTVDGTSVTPRTTREQDTVAVALPVSALKPGTEHSFQITSRLEHGIVDTNDGAEFTWATDLSRWKTSVDEPTIVVRLPKEVSSYAKPLCFIIHSAKIPIPCETQNRNGLIFTLKPGRTLQPGEEVLVMIRLLPAKVIQPSVGLTSALWFGEDNTVLISPLVIVLLCFLIWLLWGKDPSGRGRIIPEYEPPQNFSPVEIGTMIDQHVDARDIAAIFVDWAVRGYITLRESSASPLTLEASKHVSPEILTDPDEQRLFSRLFAHGDKLELAHTDSSTVAAVKSMVDDTYYKLVNKAYFVSHPAIISGAFTAAGVATTLCGLLLSPLTGTPFIVTLLCMALNGFIIIGTGYHMPRTTKNGAQLLKKIKGFKLFLAASETDLLSFANAPEKLPEHFERFLSYAMALGVEKQWAERFGAHSLSPTWYEQSSKNPLTAALLAEKLSVLTVNATSMMRMRHARKKKQ